MTDDEIEIIHLGRTVSGTVSEAYSIMEALVNSAVAYYYCNDDNKIDEFVGFVQEHKFQFKLTYLRTIATDLDLKETDENKKILKEVSFSYLHKNNKATSDKVLATDLLKALDYFSHLRNSFAHGVIKPISIQKPNGKINGFSFSVKDFKPISNSGAKKGPESIYDRIDEFTETDLKNLESDMQKMKNMLTALLDKAKLSADRIAYKQ